MWRMAEGSEGELRACRGNGAENSSQSKMGVVVPGTASGEGGHSHPREEGGQYPCPWGGGADSQQTPCPQGLLLPLPLSHFLSFPPLALVYLITKQLRRESSSTTSLTYAPTHWWSQHIFTLYLLCASTMLKARGKWRDDTSRVSSLPSGSLLGDAQALTLGRQTFYSWLCHCELGEPEQLALHFLIYKPGIMEPNLHISGRHRGQYISGGWVTTAAAAAKSLQSCPTLCDPIDGSPPGPAVPGILQARTLEWVAISSFNAWKWKVKVKSLSCVGLLATPWTAAPQAPPSMGFSRQE